MKKLAILIVALFGAAVFAQTAPTEPVGAAVSPTATGPVSEQAVGSVTAPEAPAEIEARVSGTAVADAEERVKTAIADAEERVNAAAAKAEERLNAAAVEAEERRAKAEETRNASAPKRPKTAFGMRLGFGGNGYVLPEGYLRLGLGRHSRNYLGIGGYSQRGKDSWGMAPSYIDVSDTYFRDSDTYFSNIVGNSPVMNVDLTYKLSAFQAVSNFCEWYAGDGVLSVYGGPGFTLGFYNFEINASYNREPLSVSGSATGIDFGVQGGTELKLRALVICADVRAAYGQYFWEMNVNSRESVKTDVARLTLTFGISAGLAF